MENYDVTVTVGVLAESQAQAATKLETQILTQMPAEADIRKRNSWAFIRSFKVERSKDNR
jgi:hypothetical protein